MRQEVLDMKRGTGGQESCDGRQNMGDGKLEIDS